MDHLPWLECTIWEDRGWKGEYGDFLKVKWKVSDGLLLRGLDCQAKDSGLSLSTVGSHRGFLCWEVM